MTVDYKIASTLAVHDDLSPALERIIAMARQANDHMAALTRNVMRAGQSFTTAATGADKFAKRSVAAFDQIVSGSARAKRGAEDMAKAMVDLAAKSAAAGKPFNTRSTVERVDVARHVTVFETRGAAQGAIVPPAALPFLPPPSSSPRAGGSTTPAPLPLPLSAAPSPVIRSAIPSAPAAPAFEWPTAQPLPPFQYIPPRPPAGIVAPANMLPAVITPQQRAVSNIGDGMRPAWNERIEGPRVMRDIGGSSVADQPLRPRAATPSLPGAAPGSQVIPSYPVAAGGAGGRVPPTANLPQTFGQPFMPPPMRNVGSGSTAGGAGGAGGGLPPIPPGPMVPPAAGGRGPGNHAAPVDTAAYGYVGGMLKGYGDSMFGALHAPIDKAIELERVMAGLRQKGLGDAQISEAMKFVRATQIYGTSIIDRARIFNEAQGSFRESGMSGSAALNAAKVMLPSLAGYKVAMATLDDKSHAAAEGSFSQLNKVVELMGGLNSPARAQQIVDSVFKAVQSSGKMVTERDIRMFTTQGGSAASGLNDRTIFAALEPLMGEFGGSALGTGMNTAFRNLSGLMSHPSKMMVGEAIKMGIWDKKQIQFNSQGGIGKILDRDKLVNPELLNLMRTDTVEFTKALMAIYKANGVTTVAGRERDNEILLGRTGAKVYNKMMLQLDVMEHSMHAFDAAKGVTQTNDTEKNSPMQKIMELQKRYADLQMEFGIVVLPLMIAGMERLIPLVKDLTRFVHDNAGIVKVLTVAFIGLAGAMVLGGSVLLLRAGFSGLGLALNLLTAGTGVPALAAVMGAPLLGPIAIAVLAIGTIAAACYAFRALTKEEVDAQRTDGGVKLTAGARARTNELGWKDTDSADFLKGMLAGKKTGEFATGGSKPKATGEEIAAAIKAALNGAVVNMDGESVGRLVTGHQGREAGRPSTGTSGYDSRLGVLRPDYSGL